MDDSSYRSFTTSRDLKYYYYFTEGDGEKPYLIFLHGWPSWSKDWAKQVPFFKEKGYGLVIPDELGYGGSDSPEDVTAYRMSLMCKDLIELADHEKATKAIVIGHDWGSGLATQLAVRYQERFLGFAFLALAYFPPNPAFEYESALAIMKQTLGSEVFGYWEFYNEDEAGKVITEHWDSAYAICFPEDTAVWLDHVAPRGALKEWLLNDKVCPIAKYMSPDDKQERLKVFVNSKFGGLNWYRSCVRGYAAKDDADIPKEQYIIKKPTYFGGTTQDKICRPEMGRVSMQQYCPNATIDEFDAGHWVMTELPDEMNERLLQWVNKVVN